MLMLPLNTSRASCAAYLSCDPDGHVFSVGLALLCCAFDGSQKHKSARRDKIAGLLIPVASWVCCLQ